MSLKKTILNQLVEKTKARDSVAMDTLRLLLAGIKNKEVELRAELDDDQILRVVQNQVKQRRDAMDFYEQGGRPELAEKEGQELDLLMSFMPEQLSEEAVEGAVERTIEELGAGGMKDMGRVMKKLMADLQGAADGKLVSEMVKKKLGS